MSGSHGQVASLTIVRGPQQGRRVEWDGERFVIGRKQGDLLLDDREVSGLHAAVEASGGGWVLKDLGSTNGTFLDGNKVAGSAELANGSHLKVGATYLRFEVGPGEDAEAAAPAAPAAESIVAASSGGSDDPFGELASAEVPAAPDDELIEAEPLDDQQPFGLPDSPTRVPVGQVPPAAAARPSTMPSPSPEDAPFIPPAGRHAPTSPGGGAAPPPRVGVTSHGDSRSAARVAEPSAPAAPTGEVWDSLALPEGDAPIPPSPGAAAAHVPTPLPGELRTASESPAPGAPPASPFEEPAPTPVPGRPPPVPEPEEVKLPSSIERSPHGLYLVVEAGKDRGKVFPIRRETTILGRSDIDVRIEDPDVSRKHVAIELQGRGPHLLKDLGSTNGTLLNGVKVTENLISANDIVRLGGTRLKLVQGEAAVKAELAALARS